MSFLSITSRKIILKQIFHLILVAGFLKSLAGWAKDFFSRIAHQNIR
jgi:hypothetical protein